MMVQTATAKKNLQKEEEIRSQMRESDGVMNGNEKILHE